MINHSRMKPRLSSAMVFFALLLFILSIESKSLDPYKVLGVDKNASQREIKKAFHKRSLQYHPDKNKNKGAQEKFAEINNAYEILSDEQKRKNYDLYGDEKGSPGFDAGNAGTHGGYTYYTSGGPGQSGFNFGPGDWQNMGGGGGGGGSQSFSFSFGRPGSQSSFGFGLDDIFSNLFGGNMRGGSRFGGSSSSSRSQSGSRSTPKNLISVNSDIYRKEIVNKGITWLLLSYTSTLQGVQYFESTMDEVASSLQGILKVGSINCEVSASLCKELGVYPRRAPRIFLYSYRSGETGSLVEYSGDMVVKSLKSFCQDNLPRFSKRVNIAQLDSAFGSFGSLPKVMLLSSKKNTPVIWRALSGLFHKRFGFYDAEVNDVSDSAMRRLGVDALPAIVGWLSNGEKHVLKTGISVKDLKSAIKDLSNLLSNFEKMDKKVASGKNKESQTDSSATQIPLLADNFEDICREKSPVCVIGVFRSSKSRGKLEKVLSMVSQKSLSRRQNAASGGKDTVTYALLDATKQQSFLKAFDKSGFKSSDELLLAYKPRKGKFATLSGETSIEEAERFISSVLSGDVQFTKTRQRPVHK